MRILPKGIGLITSTLALSPAKGIAPFTDQRVGGIVLKFGYKKVVAVVGLVAGLTLTSLAPAQASTWHHGQDPLASGCSGDAYTLRSEWLPGGGSWELRVSPSCGTNWIRLNSVGAYYVYGDIMTDYVIGSPTAGYGAYVGQSAWSNMVYAPGHTCIHVHMHVNNSAYQEIGYIERHIC